jgi:hypothetical protein
MYRVFLWAILSTLLFQVDACLAVDSKNSDAEKNLGIASNTLASAAKKLTTGKALNASLNWGENLEVKEVRSFSSTKRVAVISNVIDRLEKNDEIVFDKLTANEYHLAASVLTRLKALSYLGALFASVSTENELVEAGTISMQANNAESAKFIYEAGLTEATKQGNAQDQSLAVLRSLQADPLAQNNILTLMYENLAKATSRLTEIDAAMTADTQKLQTGGFWDNFAAGLVPHMLTKERDMIVQQITDLKLSTTDRQAWQEAAGAATSILGYRNANKMTPEAFRLLSIVKDYIDGEISDLKLVLANRIPYGIYRSSRKMRDDKRTMLLMTDKEFVEETLNVKIKKDPLPKELANITTMISFSEICIANLESLCIKL